MADKSFGVRELNLTNTSGTPTVSSPNQLNLSAHTVAISTSVTVGQNLTVSANAGISSLNVTGIGTVLNLNVLGVGTITSPSDANAHSRWKVTNQSASAYRFTGPGQDGSENNPNVYLVRGQRYIFDVNASGHPFQLRVANGGAAYSDGVTNNGAQSGQVIFNVQHDAPAQLYYQCTNHGSMVGNIYIVGGPQVISGVLTATSFSGSGANLTNLPAQATIANNADNRIITGGSGVNLNGEANLTFNSSLVVTDGNGTVTTGGNYINLKRTSANTNYINAPLANADLVISADENLLFHTVHTGDFNSTERVRIGSAGQIGLGGANYGTSGQVLTSGGASAAPTWATPSGGMTLLASATLSSSGTTAANISFNTAGYEYLYGKLYSVTRPSGGIGDIGLRWNGTSSAVYDFVMQRLDNNGSGSPRYTQGANQFYYNMNGVAGWTSGRNQGVFELHLVNDGVRKPFNMKHSGELNGGPLVLTTDGMLDLTSSITSLEITTSDTDINGGTLKLYGVK